jgi:hypothetical protein
MGRECRRSPGSPRGQGRTAPRSRHPADQFGNRLVCFASANSNITMLRRRSTASAEASSSRARTWVKTCRNRQVPAPDRVLGGADVDSTSIRFGEIEDILGTRLHRPPVSSCRTGTRHRTRSARAIAQPGSRPGTYGRRLRQLSLFVARRKKALRRDQLAPSKPRRVRPP